MNAAGCGLECIAPTRNPERHGEITNNSAEAQPAMSSVREIYISGVSFSLLGKTRPALQEGTLSPFCPVRSFLDFRVLLWMLPSKFLPP